MDIGATSAGAFISGDSNPGTVRTTPGGVARNIAHNLALLGDEFRLVTVFGGDGFGGMLRSHCAACGIDTSLSEVVPGARNACFVSLSGPDGELIGGIADMAVTGLMTPEWLEARMDEINKSDAVVADTNIPAASLSLLVACCIPPLYIDAVSSAKVTRLHEALATQSLHGGQVFAVKCNRIEAEALHLSTSTGKGSLARRVKRLYVSLGADGVLFREDGESSILPALPVSGIVNTTGAGDALFAGIVHAGTEASAEEAARFGQECARCAMMAPEAVNENLRFLKK